MILTKELRKALVKKIDELVKLPSLIEPFDSIILNATLKYLDDNYGDKIPVELIDDIQASVDYFVKEDWENLAMVIPNVINDIVDIPGLNEDTEGKFLSINLKAILEFLQWLAEKNK